jgi:hypothetical protein
MLAIADHTVRLVDGSCQSSLWPALSSVRGLIPSASSRRRCCRVRSGPAEQRDHLAVEGWDVVRHPA